MPTWFKIPARFITADDSEGIAIAINLDAVALIIQEKARDGQPSLNINMMNGSPLRLHGVSLEAFLALSVTMLTAEPAEPTGKSVGNKDAAD